ncbi:hypothetical protein EYR36_002317 [Pleurotus pulmonarius]|nr:hypothetical protein EYR36_002317 [Pleurotus pulmonarius]
MSVERVSAGTIIRRASTFIDEIPTPCLLSDAKFDTHFHVGDEHYGETKYELPSGLPWPVAFIGVVLPEQSGTRHEYMAPLLTPTVHTQVVPISADPVVGNLYDMEIFDELYPGRTRNGDLKVVQRAIYDVNNELVTPPEQYRVLKPGTLVLARATLLLINNMPSLPGSEVDIADDAAIRCPVADEVAVVHTAVKGIVYVLADYAYQVDELLTGQMDECIWRTEDRMFVKERLSGPDATLLLFREHAPDVPASGSFVRLHQDARFNNGLAFVVKTEPTLQIAHILALPSEFHRLSPAEDGMPLFHHEPFLYTERPTDDGALSHDGESTAYGLVRGSLPFDCLRTKSINATLQEVALLQDCQYPPILEALEDLMRNFGWALSNAHSEIVQVKPRSIQYGTEEPGIEIALSQLHVDKPRARDRVLVVDGPFAGVYISVIKYLDDETILAKVDSQQPSTGKIYVANHEIVRDVRIGDYVAVQCGPYSGCDGWATEDLWHQCRIFVESTGYEDTPEHPANACLNTWITVDFNILGGGGLAAFYENPKYKKKNISHEMAFDVGREERTVKRFIGWEVFIIRHRHLKGTEGRVVAVPVIRDDLTHTETVYEVQRVNSLSAYTYRVKESDLLDSRTHLPLRICIRMDNDKLTMLKPRESTPPPDDADTLGKPFGLDKNDAGDVNLQSGPSYGTDGVEPGRWLLDARLMHKKLEIVIRGTRSGTWFRGGIYEGKQGYLVVTDKVKNVRADIFVRVDSVVSSPWTRIPIRYVWPNGSSFRVSTRVVVTGPSIDGRDNCVGSYGTVLNCEYAIREDVRMIRYAHPARRRNGWDMFTKSR